MRGGQNVSDTQLQQILADVPKIINDQKTADVLVKRADELGQRLVNERLRMAQARDIFDELRQIESIWLGNLKGLCAVSIFSDPSSRIAGRVCGSWARWPMCSIRRWPKW